MTHYEWTDPSGQTALRAEIKEFRVSLGEYAGPYDSFGFAVDLPRFTDPDDPEAQHLKQLVRTHLGEAVLSEMEARAAELMARYG
jgi:hypothetical protein